MEKTLEFVPLSSEEILECNGGGFAYDVGCVLGFIVRSASGPVGELKALAIWYYQHS